MAHADKCYSSRCLPRSGRLETQVSHLLVLNSLYGRVGNLADKKSSQGMHCLSLTKAPEGAHFKYMNPLLRSGWEFGRRTTPVTWPIITERRLRDRGKSR